MDKNNHGEKKAQNSCSVRTWSITISIRVGMLEWQENKELPDLIVVIHSVITFYDCIAHRVVVNAIILW